MGFFDSLFGKKPGRTVRTTQTVDARFARQVKRNLAGIDLERQGKIAQAMKLYEINVAERFDGDHPYERLIAVYTKRREFDDAIRVCQIATVALAQPEKRAWFTTQLERLKARTNSRRVTGTDQPSAQ